MFLFTDIEKSTEKWEKHHAEMLIVLSKHDALLEAGIAAGGGRVIKHTGDGYFAVFEDGQPVQCALEIQKELARQEWGVIGQLRVRMALHAGDAVARGEDYFGPVINRTARILSTGWGGQVLLTPEALQDSSLPPGAALKDLGVHQLKDLGEPQPIYQLLHPELVIQDFPPLRSLSAHPHNLPAQATPFVGREKELLEAVKFLDDPSRRLLTLIGPGGMGKTRLAVQAASERIEGFGHGVYFVPLAPLSSPEFVVPAVAEALRFTFYSREDVKVQLLNYLRDKRLLLVMDNYEHLMGASQIVSELLKTAPGVKVVVTSRERLRLQGEQVLEVRGMDLPAGDASPAEESSAVQLFVQTARSVHPDFEMTPETAKDIVRVCRLLEGLPLGIELAATWVRVLSCAEIVEELQRNLNFLEESIEDLPGRHKGLRAVFEYSWALLPENEKASYRKLSVFRGGFQKEAAEKTAGAGVLALSRLADKSLIRRTASGRYEILEVLRQYSEEMLAEDPEEMNRTLDDHCRYYADFLQGREKALNGKGQKGASNQIAEEIENVRYAWNRAVRFGMKETIGKSLQSLYRFYQIRGWFQEGMECFERAVDALRSSGRSLELGKVMTRQGVFCHRLGMYEKARDLLQQALSICRDLGAREETGFVLSNLGNCAFMSGEYEKARTLDEESLSLRKAYKDKWGIAQSLNNLGLAAYSLGELEKARALHQEGLALIREVGDPWEIATSLNNLGVATDLLGEHEKARELYQESLLIRQELGDRWGLAVAYANLGDIACDLEDLEAAKRNYLEALETAMDIRVVPIILFILVGLADLLRKEGSVRQPLEILSFVLNHPAIEGGTREKVERLLVAMQSGLDSATWSQAMESGATKTLEELVSALESMSLPS